MTKEAVVVEKEDDELDGVFEDETDEVADTAVKEETKVTTDSDDTATAAKDDKTTGDGKTAPPAEEAPKSVPIAALHDERRKRKAAEEEAEQLRQQLPQDEANAPDRFEEPEAYDNWLMDKWQKEQDAKSHKAYVASVEQLRSDMLAKHDDFLEVETTFYVLAQHNPALKQEMFDSKDPAAFAYEKGNEWMAEQRAKIVAELEADGYTKKEAKAASDDIVDAEIISETVEAPKVKTPSLATATAAASNTIPVEKDEDIKDMFEDQAY